MHITHDKESGALYLKLREGRYDHTEDFSEGADVYLDVDADGNVLGLEALSFEDLAQAIGERGGRLELPERLGLDNLTVYEDAMRAAFDEGLAGAIRTDEHSPEEVRAAMASLGEDDREVLKLLISENLNIVDFAERLGVSGSEAQRTRRVAYEKLNDALRRRDPASGRAPRSRPAAG